MDTKDISEEQYRLLIKQLREKAQEAGGLGDVAAEKKCQNAASRLEAWLEDGMAGPCPVEPADYDLDAAQQGTEAQPPDDQPGEATLEKRLADVEKALEKGEFVEARSLNEILEARPELEKYPHLKNRAEDLKHQIRSAIQLETSKILQAAHEASAAGNSEKALSLYQEVLRLDPGNELATEGKQGVRGTLTPITLTDAELNNLAAGLKTRKDLTRLGDAIDKVEVLVAEGRAPERLTELMPEALAEYEKMRVRDGDLTTMMRFGDLEARIKAKDEIAEKVASGHKTIFNPTLNKDQVAFEVLQEANTLVNDASEDTAQHELQRAKEHLPEHPEWAKKRLVKAIDRPLDDQHKNALKSMLSNVEKQIALKEKAEAIIGKAADADDETESYRLHLQADAIFPHTLSVKTNLVLLALAAENETVNLIEAKVSAARRKLDDVDLILDGKEALDGYEHARSLARDARKAAARWPNPKNPKRIDVGLKSVKELDVKIDARQKLRSEFEAEAAAVRDQLGDPDRRAAGIKAQDALIGEARYEKFSFAMDQLRGEADQYKEIGDIVSEIDAEADQGNWERVHELAAMVLKSGKAGNVAAHVRTLRNQAQTELDVRSLKELLKPGRDEIGKAEDLYRKIVKSAPEKEAKLGEERAELDKCLAAEDMEKLYAEAMGWKKAHQKRSLALVALRHIGHLHQDPPEGEFPPFERCRHTAEARRIASQLGDEIRDEKLPLVMRVYKEMRL